MPAPYFEFALDITMKSIWRRDDETSWFYGYSQFEE